MNIVRPSASPRLFRHHGQVLGLDFHSIDPSLLRTLIRRVQAGWSGINEGGFGPARLADRRRTPQHVVLSAQQLLEPLVVLLLLIPMSSGGPRSGGRWNGTLPLLLPPVLPARHVQFRVQIEAQPLGKQRYALLRARRHGSYEFLRVQRVFVVLRALATFRRLDGAAGKFGVIACTMKRKRGSILIINSIEVRDERNFRGSYSRRWLDLAHHLIEIEASHLVSGLRCPQQSRLDHQTTVVARFRLLDPRKFRAYLRQV